MSSLPPHLPPQQQQHHPQLRAISPPRDDDDAVSSSSSALLNAAQHGEDYNNNDSTTNKTALNTAVTPARIMASQGISPAKRKAATFASRTLVVASYTFDWVVLGAFGGVGYYLGKKEPNKRPFSLVDPNISFPHKLKETVPASLATGLNTGIPAAVILFVCLTLIAVGRRAGETPARLRRRLWMRRLWELHASWLGLALSLALAWFATNALKNLMGRPRPDMLARCQPDLANAAAYVVGGFAGDVPPAAAGGQPQQAAAGAEAALGGQLVSADICTSTDASTLDDGFRSFPSGHSSSSAAGLLYLTLFLTAKLGVAFPVLATPSSFAARLRGADAGERALLGNGGHGHGHGRPLSPDHERLHRRLAAASAPPIYLLVLALAPVVLAVFIAASRWFDFRHHATDILSGFALGVVSAWLAFRYYHLPLVGYGGGWAWGPRGGSGGGGGESENEDDEAGEDDDHHNNAGRGREEHSASRWRRVLFGGGVGGGFGYDGRGRWEGGGGGGWDMELEDRRHRHQHGRYSHDGDDEERTLAAAGQHRQQERKPALDRGDSSVSAGSGALQAAKTGPTTRTVGVDDEDDERMAHVNDDNAAAAKHGRN